MKGPAGGVCCLAKRLETSLLNQWLFMTARSTKEVFFISFGKADKIFNHLQLTK
jgi:hypothetical protein